MLSELLPAQLPDAAGASRLASVGQNPRGSPLCRTPLPVLSCKPPDPTLAFGGNLPGLLPFP